MKVLVLLFVTLGLMAFLMPSVEALFGLGRKKKDKKKEEEAAKAIDPAEAVTMGMETMMKQMSDPETLQQTMAMMKDPETMAEVEKLMSSPEFKSEMEALMEKPEMKAAIEAAQEMMQDPEKMQAVMTDIQKGMAGLAEGLTGTGGGKSAASLGLDGLAQAAGDSNFLKEALGMLDDPEVQAEVKKLMEDPSFKAEMEGMMARPEYQEAMKKAQDELAELSKDPAKFAELQEQARAMMNS